MTPAPAFLTPSHDLWIVAASLLIASFASYVALDLSRRVRTHERRSAVAWWIGGSLAMGTGIWAMHFVGMLAMSLPIPLGYTRGLTFGSWVAGVGVSAIALAIASAGRLTARWLAAGSLAMGAGICAMHYLGMAALDMAPGIVWDGLYVALSAVIAVLASGAALLIFFWLRRAGRRRAVLWQALAALVMGVAINGMHYTGMAAASFPAGSVCLSAQTLPADKLVTVVVLASAVLLAMTLFTSLLDARAQSRTARLAASLQRANQELQRANEALREQALVDPLTRLPNRSLFEDRLRHALARQQRAPARDDAGRLRHLAVLFIDLDGFKPVNDSFCHDTGDLVLRQVALRLQAAARAGDTVARIGGDEFLLLMEDARGVDDCIALAHRLIAAVGAPLDTRELTLGISCSIGIVLHMPGQDASRLVAQADAAMYAAKRAGGSTCALFEAHMDGDAAEELRLQQDLRRALERGELGLAYQPKVDARSGHVTGVEALLRWRHPERGMVSPAVFVPLAERSGLIGGLGAWVLDEACRQQRAWTDAGISLRVAINLSMPQLRDAALVPQIEQALSRHRVDPSHLLCEVTESLAMDDLAATQRSFDGLARLGVFLSIDDFGTGHSSLALLRQLPARQLKIDRSFVRDLEHSDDARAVVDAVVYLAHRLGLAVVAEGVETLGQREVLVGLGCDELQGYLYARPMAPEDLLAWLTGRLPGPVALVA